MKTLEENEQIIERGLQSFIEMGEAFGEIKELKLYKGRYGSGATWTSYLKDRWNTSQSMADKLIEASQIAKTLKGKTDNCLVLPTAEGQIRPLRNLSPEKQVEAWNKAIEKSGGKVPTAKQVKEAVEETQSVPINTIKHVTVDHLERLFDRMEPPPEKMSVDYLNPHAFKMHFDGIFSKETQYMDDECKREFAKYVILALYELYPELENELNA